MLDEDILPEEELDEFNNPKVKKPISGVNLLFRSEAEEDINDFTEEVEESPDDYVGLTDGEDEPTGDY